MSHEPHEVLMPQLGMAQNSAVIVTWRKEVGDPVGNGEALLEVETDKAVMEVEARRDGYLVRIDAPAGSEVPVGQVIALIADSADAVVAEAPAAPAPAEEAPPAAPAAPAETTPKTTPAAPVSSRPASSGGRILASPKARRLAAERGVTLRQLLDMGMSEPILARDLPDEAALAAASADAVAAAGARRTSVLRARYAAAEFAEFARWAGEYSSGALDTAAIWASFALTAHDRAAGDAPDRRATPWRVQVQSLSGEDRLLALSGNALNAIEPAEPANGPPDLYLHELSDSAIDDVDYSGAATPALVITRCGDEGRLALLFDDRSLALGTAMRWLDGIARRGVDPLRHLL